MQETKQLELVEKNILANTPSPNETSFSGGRVTNFIPFATDNVAPKQSFTRYSGENRSNALIPLSDGTYTPRFDSYRTGIDNEELLAKTQSTTDKWLNGTTKFFAKTGSAILGGTVGIGYGVGKLIEDGSFTSLYDNEFSNTLADWDTKLSYKLPNYYTKQEQDKNLVRKFLLHYFLYYRQWSESGKNKSRRNNF